MNINELVASHIASLTDKKYTDTTSVLANALFVNELKTNPEMRKIIEQLSEDLSIEKLEEIDKKVQEIRDKNPNFEKAADFFLELKNLYVKAIFLIPIEEYLAFLFTLRQPSFIYPRLSFKGILRKFYGFFIDNPDLQIEVRRRLHQDHFLIEKISHIESIITLNISETDELKIKGQIESIDNELNLLEARLKALYSSLLNPALHCDELVRNMVSKIGHQDLSSEAGMHSKVVDGLAEQLRLDYSSSQAVQGTPFTMDTPRIISSMVDIEKRRLIIEKLIRIDWRRKRNTTVFIILYILVLSILLVYLIVHGATFQVGSTPMHSLSLPFIGIPWPVILWSLIGSFASMIHRFNSTKVPDFGNAIKWLITRPVQGVVLGSAFYLVLISGLFLLTGQVTTDTEAVSVVRDEIVLVLSFLVGFSDKFANSVFNTLVENFSNSSNGKT